MDAKPTDDKRGEDGRKSYLAPSREGRKAVTVHLSPVWVMNLRIYGVKKGRPLQGLVEEALDDLAKKLKIDLELMDEDDASEAQDTGQ